MRLKLFYLQYFKYYPTKKIGNYIYIDEARKEWAIPTSFFSKIKKVHKYSDIISFDLLEDIIAGNQREGSD